MGHAGATIGGGDGDSTSGPPRSAGSRLGTYPPRSLPFDTEDPTRSASSTQRFTANSGGGVYRGIAGVRADWRAQREKERVDKNRADHVAAVQAALQLSGRIQTFDEFWKRHCRWISNLAFTSFYVGSGCVWGAVIVFFYGMFDDVLVGAAGVFVGICSVSLLASLVLVVRTLREDVGVRIETRSGYTSEGAIAPEPGLVKF